MTRSMITRIPRSWAASINSVKSSTVPYWEEMEV